MIIKKQNHYEHNTIRYWYRFDLNLLIKILEVKYNTKIVGKKD